VILIVPVRTEIADDLLLPELLEVPLDPLSPLLVLFQLRHLLLLNLFLLVIKYELEEFDPSVADL
jgi:hypothetical protein